MVGQSAGFVNGLRLDGREWQVRVSRLPAQDTLTRPAVPTAAFTVASPPAARGKTGLRARTVIKLTGGKTVRVSESVALAGLQGQRQGLTEKEGDPDQGLETSSFEPSGMENESSPLFHAEPPPNWQL